MRVRHCALALLIGLSGCLGGSTVVAPEARAVRQEAVEPDWRAASPEELQGLFESVRIEGEAAAALWRLSYWFAADGSYTGAALVFDGERAAFQTLSGAWSLQDGLLELDAGPPARASVADDSLRLESDAGLAVFRRVDIE